MIVYLPHCEYDEHLYGPLMDLINHFGTDGHEIVTWEHTRTGRYKIREKEGRIPRSRGKDVVCCEQFCVAARETPDNEWFLWLEPDCCPVIPSWLNVLDDHCRQLTEKHPEACVTGCGKWTQAPNMWNHIGGVACYRATPALKAATLKMTAGLAFDVYLHNVLPAVRDTTHFHTDLIADHICVQPLTPTTQYLLQYPEAVLIHGEAMGGLVPKIREGFPNG